MDGVYKTVIQPNEVPLEIHSIKTQPLRRHPSVYSRCFEILLHSANLQSWVSRKVIERNRINRWMAASRGFIRATDCSHQLSSFESAHVFLDHPSYVTFLFDAFVMIAAWKFIKILTPSPKGAKKKEFYHEGSKARRKERGKFKSFVSLSLRGK